MLQMQIDETVKAIEEGVDASPTLMELQMINFRNQVAMMESLKRLHKQASNTIDLESGSGAVRTVIVDVNEYLCTPDARGHTENEYVCEKCRVKFVTSSVDWTFDKTHEVWIHWVVIGQQCGVAILKDPTKPIKLPTPQQTQQINKAPIVEGQASQELSMSGEHIEQTDEDEPAILSNHGKSA